jgi:hypothetical protein
MRDVFSGVILQRYFKFLSQKLIISMFFLLTNLYEKLIVPDEINYPYKSSIIILVIFSFLLVAVVAA